MSQPDATPSVCIVDFCGYVHPGHFPYSCWADYYPDHHVMTFGGEWRDVPDMPCRTEPQEHHAELWAKLHIGSIQNPKKGKAQP